MLSKRIKQLRESHGETQQKMAENLGVSQQTIAGWEKGQRNPSLETLSTLADYFGVSVDYLLGRTDIPNIYIHDIEVDGKHGRIASTQKDLSPEYQEQVRAKVQNAIKEDRGVKISASDLPSNRAELEALVQQIVDQALKKQDNQ